jgi:rhodanese-related sulfurtransferase
MKPKVLLAVIVVVFVGLLCASCTIGTGGRSGRTIEIVRLSPKDAYAFLQTNRNNPGFVLIDIRTPAEHRDGHIEKAVNMSLHSDSFEADVRKLDKGKTYMVYCRTGRRTAIAVDMMEKAGFTKVYLIAGDILGWKSEGLPLVR